MCSLNRLALLCVTLVTMFLGCSAPGSGSLPAENTVGHGEATATPEQVPPVKTAPPNSEDALYITVPIRDVTISLNDNPNYEGDVVYPQLAGEDTFGQRAFNRYLDRLVRTEVDRFKLFCRREARHPANRRLPLGYGLRCSYAVSFASPQLVSVTLTWASFTGYVNEDYSTTAITMDLRTGKHVALRNLFKKGSNYLQTISAYCIADLRATYEKAGEPSVLEDLEKNAGPRPENYHTWSISRHGLGITFAEYQVGPGMLGLIHIDIPYKELAAVADPQGCLALAANAASDAAR